MERIRRQTRSGPAEFTTRAEESGELYIEGYFSVFHSLYHLWDGATETVLPGAFTETLTRDDVRALIDHNTRLVLGRTKAGTLELKEDDHGLWGKIRINSKDVDAMNLYHLVQRGDVDQCSFGFEIEEETFQESPNGSIQWQIQKVMLYEVSVVTFPAYEDTEVTARKQAFSEIQQRKQAAWCESMRKRLKEAK